MFSVLCCGLIAVCCVTPLTVVYTRIYVLLVLLILYFILSFICSLTPSSLASFKSRLVLPFWYKLTQVVLERRLLNGCSSSVDLWLCDCVAGRRWCLCCLMPCGDVVGRSDTVDGFWCVSAARRFCSVLCFTRALLMTQRRYRCRQHIISLHDLCDVD